MKELRKSDLMFAFEHEITMALYALEKYNVEAYLALIACDDYDIDDANIIKSVKECDIAKRINKHYIAVLFCFVDHIGARSELDKLMDHYKEYNLKGSLIELKKGENIESVYERILEANELIHEDSDNTVFDEEEHIANT